MPKIAEMDVEMKTYAEVTFKSTTTSSKVAPIEAIVYDFLLVLCCNFSVQRTVYEKFDVKQSNDLEISPRSAKFESPESRRLIF